MKKQYFIKFAYIYILSLVCLSCQSCLPGTGSEAPSNLLEAKKVQIQSDYASDAVRQSSRWFGRDFSPERQLLTSIRNSLANKGRIESVPELNIKFDPSFSYVCVTLFQHGRKPIRWISKRKTLLETLNRIIFKLTRSKRFEGFDAADPNRCRILLEVVTGEQPLDINKMTTSQINKNRYEPGITGFKLKYNDRTYYYMPIDAVVYSHLTIKHALNHLSKKVGVAKKTKKISQRVWLMKSLPAKWSTLTGVAFVTYENDIIALHRGYPALVEFSQQRLVDTATKSVDWIYRNMNSDGKFLYYYDGVKDTVIDHAHPTRNLENNYYNILRHNGGIIALLNLYELTHDRKYINAGEKALDYLIQQVRTCKYRDRDVYYVYYNSKAKLGGSGTALVALMRYYQATGDTKYNKYIYGIAWHLLSRVDEDGEMIGYYIHPSYNNGQPIIEPTPQEKKELFSFYYPGEALLGLALFEQQMPLKRKDRRELRQAAQKALDFLVDIRPKKYADMFKSLPSDGWLMQAIEQWSHDRKFKKKEYLDFVFNDARQMLSHMYKTNDSLYYDYPGTFYYNYGDHAFAEHADDGTYYATASEWVDSIVEYVRILTIEMGFTPDESLVFADKYLAPVTESGNTSLATYVLTRLAEVGI